ncbi:MAG: HAD-IIA family hydrolase [Erysipelotrichaceae bacterium]|nr:HAD-IIA family hydrolase [Erysipelotrichaceae bacterium]MCI9313037.1 HAD-IIA family hydrolase [Erysipelotrichaceae bacterium]
MGLNCDKTYLIDLDGTMIQGDKAIAGAPQFIQYLQEHGIAYVFVTNNAMRTPVQIMEKMHRMGFANLKEEDFFTSAMAAVSHVKKVTKERRAFMIGEAGLAQALTQGGFIMDRKQAKLVFVGLDRHADFTQYCEAANLIRNRHALFIGTNGDRRVPQGDHFLIGNGAILNMLIYASETDCILIGKPSAIMMEETLAYVGKRAAQCVVIGDNLDTDIAFGKQNGVSSILVCSGVHNRSEAKNYHIQADLIVDSLCELLIN